MELCQDPFNEWMVRKGQQVYLLMHQPFWPRHYYVRCVRLCGRGGSSEWWPKGSLPNKANLVWEPWGCRTERGGRRKGAGSWLRTERRPGAFGIAGERLESDASPRWRQGCGLRRPRRVFRSRWRRGRQTDAARHRQEKREANETRKFVIIVEPAKRRTTYWPLLIIIIVDWQAEGILYGH